MEKYIPILENTKLFSGADSSEIAAMLDCMQAKLHKYKKGEYVLHQGDVAQRIYILAEGALHIRRDDYWGNRSIVSVVEAGDMFAEAYSAGGSAPLQNDVVAEKDSVVISFDVNKLLHVCPSGCSFHSLVIRNLFAIIADKNRFLVRKLGLISQRTTREKLTEYLSQEAKRSGNPSFKIPYNRQQLADFLSVDRSAMSNELCKMRDEGLLTFRKNEFNLL